MIEFLAYLLVFPIFVLLTIIVVTIVHYLMAFLFWFMDIIFDPFLLNKFDK